MRAAVRRMAAPLAVLLLLVGCGESAHRPDRKTLTVWMYPVIADRVADERFWDGIARDFERTHPGVRLTVSHRPWADRDRKLAEAFAEGTGPDVVLLTPDQVAGFEADGSIRPVDEAVRGRVFRSAARAALTRRGRLFGAPVYQTVTATIYNTRLLAEAGVASPPATWEEILAAAPKLRRRGVAVLDFSASDEATANLNYYPLLWQAGGRVFSEDGTRTAFAGPAGVRALTFLARLYQAGGIPESGLRNTNLLAGQALGEQRAAMGYSVVLADADLAARLWGRENVQVGSPLRGPEREVAFGIPGSLSVNAASAVPDTADAFLSFMTEREQVKSLGRASGYLSPLEEVEVPNASPYTKQYRTALASVFPGEPHPEARGVMRLLGPEIRAAMTGRKSPQRALDDAAAAADRLLRERRAAPAP
ncbi:extracellular solute-binding protein [Streptomyces sp. NPDC047097]|uniref:extracellular solute-binding protein n=1 Tax=Streptomyces sp. NPDC047097 TaxID=3155260 RepID=UPI0033DFED90